MTHYSPMCYFVWEFDWFLFIFGMVVKNNNFFNAQVFITNMHISQKEKQDKQPDETSFNKTYVIVRIIKLPEKKINFTAIVI